MLKKWIVLALVGLSGVVFAQAAPSAAPAAVSPDIPLETKVELINMRVRKLEKEVAVLKTGKISAPLDMPYVSSEQLLSWTTNSILTIYTYSYSNYPEVLKNIRYLFTQGGYDSYVKALESSGNLQMVQDKKWIVSPTLTGTPRILKEGLADEAHLWEVELPLTLNFENASTHFKQNMLLNLQISRVVESVNAQGVAIQSITAQLLPDAGPANDQANGNASQKGSAPEASKDPGQAQKGKPETETSIQKQGSTNSQNNSDKSDLKEGTSNQNDKKN